MDVQKQTWRIPNVSTEQKVALGKARPAAQAKEPFHAKEALFKPTEADYRMAFEATKRLLAEKDKDIGKDKDIEHEFVEI